jgi:hypothetical protein
MMNLIPFFSAVICSNVWAANGNLFMSVVWILVAVVVLAVDKLYPEKS